MALRIVFADPQASVQYREAMQRTLNAIARASSKATRAAAKVISVRGKQDIARAGQFGTRWLDGLSVDAQPASGYFINNRIEIGHDQLGARNFEEGGTVRGRPTLWVPLSFANVPKGQTAKNYPGGLFRVTTKAGKDLLLSVKDKKPKFIGLSSVRIPKKWHLRDIGNDVMANEFPKLYADNFEVS